MAKSRILNRVLVLSGVNCCGPFQNNGIEADYFSAELVSKRLDSLDAYDMVCFSGGTDVSPSMYNQERIPETQRSDSIRDAAETVIYNYCKAIGLPMVGICRGIQFLNVMNGGQLIQHCDGHGGRYHTVKVLHDVYRYSKGTTFVTNSYHHQLCVPNESAIVLVETFPTVGFNYKTENGSITVNKEIEALWWPHANAAGVQWHPEWMSESSDGNQFFLNMLDLVMQ